MNFLRRINLFWLGVGALLSLFCGNEVVAFHTMKVRLWLGGTMIYVPMVLGLLLGLMVMAFLGIEEEIAPGDMVPPPGPEARPEPEPATGAEADLAPDEGGRRESLASGAPPMEA